MSNTKNLGALNAKIRQAHTLNEIWAAFNEFYNLDEQLGAISGPLAKAQIIKNIENIVIQLNVQSKGENKKRFLNF